MSGIYKARRNRCSDGRRNNVHGSGRTRWRQANCRIIATSGLIAARFASGALGFTPLSVSSGGDPKLLRGRREEPW